MAAFRNRILHVVLVVVLGLLPASSTRLKATAVLVDQADESGRHRVDGRISFVQANCTSAVAVKGVIFGLSDGLHGFHVHEFGLLDGDCTTSGHHYNPFKKNHGGPGDAERHVGDLGNVEAKFVAKLGSTQATVELTDDVISLCPGPRNVVNRTLIVHSHADDLGRGGDAESLHHGHSGRPVACGVILLDDKID